ALGQMFVAEAPVAIVACADFSRSRPRYGARGERYALIDAAFASLLLLLGVTEAGLGATFVGAFRDAEVKRLLGLPEHVQPLAIIPVGVPAESPRPLRRRKPAEVLRRERW
ncbi:MAG: nitroreductase family protein, partial [Candidatus Binatia bacterium]